jgi:hypothetical protein
MFIEDPREADRRCVQYLRWLAEYDAIEEERLRAAAEAVDEGEDWPDERASDERLLKQALCWSANGRSSRP